jgi:hypothetical protein
MNPISQIELNTHFKDLERQVASARRSQGAFLSWLGPLWRQRKPAAPEDARETRSADACACPVSLRGFTSPLRNPWRLTAPRR